MSSFLLLLAAIGQTITDPGFEVPTQGAGKWVYRPAGSAWSFTGSAGLSGNKSGFTGGNPAAPQGGQVALLQRSAQVAQTVARWPAGVYQISFSAAQRWNWPTGGSHQDLQVLVDGVVVSTITPTGAAYQTYHTATFPVAAGDHTLALVGTNTSADNTAFVDAVTITAASSIVPAVTAAAHVASSGKMIGFTFRAMDGGAPVIPTQILTPPTITVNGQPLGSLGTQWSTGYHPVVLMGTPGNYQIRPGALVQITAPLAWAYAGTGPAQALDSATAENRAGKPILATETLPRTLRIGVNNNQAPTSSGLGFYFPFRNLKYRAGWPPGNRGRWGAPPVYQPIDYHAAANGVDGTQYPGVAGLWLVMWDATNPATPVRWSISTSTPDLCTVTERADLARAPPDGIGMCRVFDVEPIENAPSAGFNVSLSYADPAWNGTPAYSNLWVCQPGDWDLANGQVVLDRSDPMALSRIYQDRVGSGVGSLRWVDSTICGGNPASCPYPEFLPRISDENWGDLSFYREIRGYVSAGPVDVAATPYIYSPFYTQPGQSYTATLGTAVTTTPAAGTRETWTITDGASAPLMAGLELAADGEVCRVISGSGSAWTVTRGSNGTKPTTHPAGQVTVSGRRSVRDVLSALGGMPKGLVVQLTTQTPHGRTTGNAFSFNGSGWPTMTFTDGSTWNMQGFGRQCYVTGPNTCFLAVGSSKAGGVPVQVYPLDPNRQQWDYRSYGGIPIEAAAIATGRFPKADLHVNVPLDAVDDMVWEIARRVLANFPAGRKVYVEYANEPWNWAFTGFYYHSAVMSLCVPDKPYQLAHYAWRAGQVHAIFRAVFAAAGRGAEIQGLVNCQMGSGPTQVTPYLEHGLKLGTPFDAVAVAPYWSLEDTPYNKQVAAALDDEQLIDVVMADQRTNPRGNNASMNSVTSAVAAFNTSKNQAVKLIGYEGGIEFAIPGDEPRNHDLIYNPNWYFAELDWIAWCQQSGLERLHIYSHAMWWNPHGWGGYHTPQQTHSRGDGLNGAAKNTAWTLRGRTTVFNQDLHVDAVRPQAWLDWLGTLAP